jgi:Leucine-rich repeat (LRR) protein
MLYLNDNKLKNLPLEVKELKNLKYLDIYHNPLVIPVDVIKKTYGGIKINL